MKKYIILFLASFIGFLLLFVGGIWLAGGFNESSAIISTVTTSVVAESTEEPSRVESQIKDEPSIVNVLTFGLNDGLADTIIVLSINLENKIIHGISIPRDTYHYIPGYEDPTFKKINAVYSMKERGGVLGMKNEVSKLLGIPIHYYVKVEFSGVTSIVDTLGGYDVNIPYDMNYDDEYQNLHIHLKKGMQQLTGEETLKFLRFRQNNSRTIQEGDLIRIPRQQEFVKSMIAKALDGNLVNVLQTVITGEYVQTNIQLEDALQLAVQVIDVNISDVVMHILEGEADFFNQLSYFVHDKEKLEYLVKEIYGL